MNPRARTLVIALTLATLVPVHAAGQDGTRPNQVTIDATILGAEIGYARRLSDARLVGAQIGAGGSFVERMLVAGDHFSEGQNDLVFEMLSASAFLRHEPHRRWQIDIGVRTSAFLHFDDADDDPGGGLFYGGYVAAFWGWEHIRVGPRVLFGVFDEGVGSEADGAREFGVHIAPINVRAIIDW